MQAQKLSKTRLARRMQLTHIIISKYAKRIAPVFELTRPNSWNLQLVYLTQDHTQVDCRVVAVAAARWSVVNTLRIIIRGDKHAI